MLELTDLSVARGATPVVESLTLTLAPGRVFWVVGPNGAGKSSLLRVLAGLDRPRSGVVARRLPPGEPLLYFHSETTLPGAATPGDWERLARRVLPAPAARRTPLWPAVPARRRAGRLSTGERKRLLLDVLLRRPASLLLDEPFEHLSPDAKRDLAGILRERSRRHLVVVATNQVTELAARDGGLRLDGGHATPLAGGVPGADGGADADGGRAR